MMLLLRQLTYTRKVITIITETEVNNCFSIISVLKRAQTKLNIILN